MLLLMVRVPRVQKKTAQEPQKKKSWGGMTERAMIDWNDLAHANFGP